MFTLTISTGNAAFEDAERGQEVARILREVAKKVEGNVAGIEQGGPVRDINGNTVGEWAINGD